MKIKDFNLPLLFVQMISSGQLKREIGSWNLIKDIDAYGNHLETELGEVYDTSELLTKETNELPNVFEANGDYGEPKPDLEGPGAIPDILDFKSIICFAISGDGSPFCFDYRESIDNPSVIWWDDVYWRRIAPSFNKFIELFNIQKSS